MAGTFILGETKVRPGTYFNIQKKGGNAAAGVMNGVTAVIFRADFGPLNEARARHLLFREEAIRRCMHSGQIIRRCSVRA